MPVSTTWVNPAAGGALDLATGAIITETWVDGVASDLLRLGGTTGAVTQTAYAAGATSTITTTSTSYVDLTDMSVTLTTTGGDVIVVFFGSFSNNTVGGAVGAAISMDAAAEVSAVIMHGAANNFAQTLATMVKFTAPSSASHTWKGRWNVGAGTTGTGITTCRYLLAAELKR